ncbi:ABC transporter permease subunit [Streptomyces sp. M19]
MAAVLSGAPLTARVVAAQSAYLRSSGHVRAAVERGETIPSVLCHEVLPALRGLVTADAGLRLVTALQIAAALAVLGLGPQPPTPDWALMLSENLPGAALNPMASSPRPPPWPDAPGRCRPPPTPLPGPGRCRVTPCWRSTD